MAEDSTPLSYARIENAMRDAVNQMGEFTHTFAGAADDAAIAEAEFKVAFAKSRLQARAAGDHEGRKITESYADDLAMVATENERMRMEQTKAKYDATRQALLSVRSRIEALRSLMTSHREAGG